jgi:ATP-dependent helicase/nuclease subunit A
VSEAILSDSAARELAQTCFARPLLVEAGAGTGKTAALVARVVVWALGPGWDRARERVSESDAAVRTLSGIVAITFTEAAAAEMATRIALDLAKIASGATPPGYFASAPLPAEEKRRARARALIGALDHLTVRTIHAFCRRLLAAHPLEAGLHPDLEVDADAVRADAIAREVIEAKLAALPGAARGDDLAALADAGFGPKALHEALVKLLEEGTRPEDLDEELLGDQAVREFARELSELARGIAALEDGALARTRAKAGAQLCERLCKLAADLETAAASGLSLSGLAPIAAEDRTGEIKKLGEWARGSFGDAEAACFGDQAGEIAALSRRLRDGLRHLAKLDPLALAAARRLLHALLTECTQRLRAAGVATFGALLRDAHALLLDHPEVAARVRSEIDQLLVDEFQDTDALQCELIGALAFAGVDRPALFLVGDPKQSIYGWRNADLAAYEDMRTRVLAEGGEVVRLVVNRRSVPAVLDEVERLLAPVMLEAKGLQPAYQGLEVHPERAQARGFTGSGQAAIEHWLTFARAADGSIDAKNPVGRANRLEAEMLARDLVKLRESGAPLGKVGVLLRTTTAFEPVLGALRRVGIPFVVERETKHGERRELVEARAFLRCVLDPHDQLALVAALRAPTVGVPDAALVPLWQRSFPKLVAELTGDDAAQLAALRGVVRAAAHAMPRVPGVELVAGFEDSLDAFLCGLAALRRSFESASPERFVERLREVWLLEVAEASRFLGAHRVASVDRLYRDLVAALEDADGSAAGLLAALHRSGTIAREHEEGRPRALAGDAVQVMTIHRAKGLEFEHVYLLQGHREERKPQEKETRVYRGRGRRAFELLGMPSPGAWQARVEQEVVEAHERVRLLYVAATRARERLVIGWSRKAGTAPEPEGAKSLADLLTSRADPRRKVTEAIAGGGAIFDAHGVEWRALAWQDATPLPRALSSARARDAARVERDDGWLALKRAEAEACEARTWHATASELAHAAHDEREPAHARNDEAAEEPTTARAVAPPDRERRIAMAAGTAVHAALEHADFAQAKSELAAHGTHEIGRALAALEPADERAAAEQRAHAIWQRACAGPLLARLRAVAPRILARELPVLLDPRELPPSDDAPVGFISGAIDLLYEDERGEVVVADYKTDDVSGEVELREKTAQYAGQGSAYTRAVQLALGLSAPPKFELWFLQAGACVTAD